MERHFVSGFPRALLLTEGEKSSGVEIELGLEPSALGEEFCALTTAPPCLRSDNFDLANPHDFAFIIYTLCINLFTFQAKL